VGSSRAACRDVQELLYRGDATGSGIKPCVQEVAACSRPPRSGIAYSNRFRSASSDLPSGVVELAGVSAEESRSRAPNCIHAIRERLVNFAPISSVRGPIYASIDDAVEQQRGRRASSTTAPSAHSTRRRSGCVRVRQRRRFLALCVMADARSGAAAREALAAAPLALHICESGRTAARGRARGGNTARSGREGVRARMAIDTLLAQAGVGKRGTTPGVCVFRHAAIRFAKREAGVRL